MLTKVAALRNALTPEDQQVFDAYMEVRKQKLSGFDKLVEFYLHKPKIVAQLLVAKLGKVKHAEILFACELHLNRGHWFNTTTYLFNAVSSFDEKDIADLERALNV